MCKVHFSRKETSAEESLLVGSMGRLVVITAELETKDWRSLLCLHSTRFSPSTSASERGPLAMVGVVVKALALSVSDSHVFVFCVCHADKLIFNCLGRGPKEMTIAGRCAMREAVGGCVGGWGGVGVGRVEESTSSRPKTLIKPT